MKYKINLFTALTLGISFLSSQVNASEFDQYLQQQQIIDSKFKIKKKAELNEMLAVLSAEDSKTFPLQIDHNTIIEQLKLTANKTELKGLIITPDFAQFEKDLGPKEVTQLIRKNLLQNCGIFFEHRYQLENPYKVMLELSSTTRSYDVEISQKDCKGN
jgi:mitochondrial fission protein ELM1